MSKDDDIWTSFWAWLKYKSNTKHKTSLHHHSHLHLHITAELKAAKQKAEKCEREGRCFWCHFPNEIDSSSSQELNKMKKRENFLKEELNNIDINHGREWQSSWSKIFAWTIKKFIMCCHILSEKIHSIGLVSAMARLWKMLRDAVLCCVGGAAEGMGKDLLSKHKMSYSILL